MQTFPLGWFAASLLIAVVVAFLVRQRGWSMALPLLGVGAVVGYLPIGPSAPPEPELVMALILAPLVFGEGLGSSYLDLRRVQRPVLWLAIGLVIATTAVVGLVIGFTSPVPWALAFALGAILAPTDAVAVGAVARKSNLPHRLVSILEGESLVNDGTGLTVLKVATAAAVMGSLTLLGVTEVLATSVLGGLAVGLAGGWLLSRIIRWSRDTVAANALVLIAPFGLYALAEQVHGSGILAVVVAALLTAHSSASDVRLTGRVQTASVWRQVTFILQALAFFLVGMEIVGTARDLDWPEFWLACALVPICVIAMIVTRMIFVSIMVWVGRRRSNIKDVQDSAQSGRLAILLGWSGARGPVSGLAAVSLPLVVDGGAPLPYREVIIATAFGVIAVTMLLAQTMGPLARLLRVTDRNQAELIGSVDTSLAYAALQRLSQAEEQAGDEGAPIPRSVVSTLRQQYEDRIESQGRGSNAQPTAQAQLELQRSLVRAEQEELLRLRDAEGLPDAVFRPIQHALDLRLQSLREVSQMRNQGTEVG